MFDDQDKAYFARRAEAERARAEAATDEAIGLIHMQIAAEYERRAQGEVPRPLSRIPRS